MPVQFILGRAGTGKTRLLLQQTTDLVKADPLGPAIYWILPRQATFQAERLLTASLGAFSRVRVVSFDQLGKEILIHCGDIGIPEVTALGRRMVIGHLLRLHQKQLKYYTRSAHRPGLAAELDSTFGEFERAGLDSAALDELRHAMETDERAGDALRDKLTDLHLLLNQYNNYIGQQRLDPQRRLALILKRVTDCSLLKNAQIFIDDFYDFSAHERKMLTAIAGIAGRTVISLLIDPTCQAVNNPSAMLSDLSMFHRTERTYQSLQQSLKQAAIPIEQPIVLQSIHRYQSPQLRTIEQDLFSSTEPQTPVLRYPEEPDLSGSTVTNPAPKATSDPSSGGIELCDSFGIRAEVDAVARRIKTAIAAGLRYRDIGVLVRDLAGYQEIVSASFTEHQLPYFADHRRTAAHHPLLQLVRGALLIARGNWPIEAVMSLAKSGLAGLSDDQADELENYVLKHRIRGKRWESPEPWEFKRDLIRSEDESGLPILTETNHVDAYRRSLHEKLLPVLELSKPNHSWPIREIATRIFTLLESFDVRSQLLAWMNQAQAAGDLERQAEHEQVWAEFTDLFDHLVDLLGDQTISLTDFLAVLDSGLESFDLALAPPKVDQILLGQIDRTRPPELKMVFVLGLNEGTFPRVTNERSVISDRERRALRSQNIDLDLDSDRRLLDERFLAYVAFTRPSQRLILSRSTADDAGRPTNPSSLWLEILRLFPGIEVQSFTRITAADPQSIGTPRQLVTSLLRWVREGADTSAPLWPALYQWLATSAHNAAVRATRDQAWRALHYDNPSHLDRELASQLFPAPLYVRVPELESMAACPFQHFARYGLQLRGRDRTEVTGIDLSNAYHDILENLVNDLLQTNQDWCSLQPAQAKEMIRTHAAEIGRRLRGELMLTTSRNRYLLDRIERTLEQACAAMTEMNRRGRYRPQYAGLQFGQGQTLPPYSLTTPAGAQVQLHGKIDRVDLNHKKTGFTVADYKLSAGALSLDRVYHGLSLQLLTYLLVIQANGQQLVGRKLTPAAAFLMQLLRSPQSVDHPSEALDPNDPKFHLRLKPRGVIESRAIASLDEKLAEGHSEVVGVYIKKDGTPGNRHATDVADQAEFEGLLQLVQTRLGEIADQVIAGDVSVAPYMIGRQTPCPHCEYRSVCRFEPGVNHYRMLTGMKRDEVLRVVSGKVEELG
jgi:ATP-dependent helicase/nuclease subunit B